MYTSYGFIGKDKIEYVSDEEAYEAEKEAKENKYRIGYPVGKLQSEPCIHALHRHSRLDGRCDIRGGRKRSQVHTPALPRYDT